MRSNGLLTRIDERMRALSISHEELRNDVKEIKEKLFSGSKKIGMLKLMMTGLWGSIAVLGAGLVYIFKRILES